MKETGLIFRGDSVRAIQSGAKTQDRPLVKPEMHHEVNGQISARGFYQRDRRMRWNGPFTHEQFLKHCPYGGVGDLLYLKETWQHTHTLGFPRQGSWEAYVRYKADGSKQVITFQEPPPSQSWWLKYKKGEFPWQSPLFMPKRFARIWLEITAEPIPERIQDITEEDAIAEGILRSERTGMYVPGACMYPDWAFRARWNSTYPGSWERNDWVWPLKFRRIER